MNHLNVLLCTIILLGVLVTCLGQDKAKRLVCSMTDAHEKEPIKLTGTGEGVKVVPFSVSGATGLFKSLLPLLKNLPVINSPSEIPSTPIQTESQNISLSCDVVTTGVKDQISKLESEVAKLRGIIEKLEGKDVCPGGFVYLDRCFRLMEIRGKQFLQRKAEDLCNFNGGVLAKIDSDLLFLRASSHLAKKLLATKYQNRTFIRVWLGMKYQLPPVPVTGGPFPFPSLGSFTTSTRISSVTPFSVPSSTPPTVSDDGNLKTAFSLPPFGLPILSTEENPKTPKTPFSVTSKSQPTTSTDGKVGTEFFIPFLGPSTESTGRNQKNRFLRWSLTYPTNTAGHDRIALQFRFNRTHNRTISAGAVNLPRRRVGLPFCQFYLNDWDSVDSSSSRLFRFVD